MESYSTPRALSIGILVMLPMLHILRTKTSTKEENYQKFEEIKTFLIREKKNADRDMLQARAIPNERLIKAFKLANTFVSSDPDIHNYFVNEAKYLLNIFQNDWKKFLSTADLAVVHSVPHASTPFNRLVQAVTLRTVLVGLLHAASCPCNLDSQSIEVVSRLTTEIWIKSKSSSSTDPEDLDKLNQHLRELVQDETSFHNPLDILIPAWETLWRLVACCIARVHDNPEFLRIISDFRDNPTSEQFSAVGTTGISAKFILLETLRLHPPVRRIHRMVKQRPPHLFEALGLGEGPMKIFGFPTEVVKAADIEGAMRLPENGWGDDVSNFRPSRFTGNEDLQRMVDIAFGAGPLKCIAANWSKRAAIAISAALLDQVAAGGGKYELVAGERIGGRDGWEGWEVRKKL